MKKYISEFIGTFALVFAGTGAVIVNSQTDGTISHLGIAATFGAIIMTMIYALGNISGAHFNPAVTIAFTVVKRFKLKEVLPYVISQVAGALLASTLLKVLFPDDDTLGTALPAGSEMQSFILELIITFFLMLVIISVAHGSKEQGMFAGLAIGSTIMLNIIFAGPITGGSMNPARSLAPAILSGHFEHLWIYILAPILGACAAVLTWNYIRSREQN